MRLQTGGCIDHGDGALNQNSCPAGTLAGAKFQDLAANVWNTATGKTVMPPHTIKKFNGGTDTYFGGLDIDAFASYLSSHSPYTPGPLSRVTLAP